MKGKKTTRRWRRRPWEDRQVMAGHDPRVLVELQVISDRVHSGRHSEEQYAARWW
jgi:hypothetical protein